MPLISSILNTALQQAFVAGETAMENTAKLNITQAKQVVTNDQIKKAGGVAFAAIATPAIDAYIKSGLVTTAVVTAGSAVAQTGTGTGTIS